MIPHFKPDGVRDLHRRNTSGVNADAVEKHGCVCDTIGVAFVICGKDANELFKRTVGRVVKGKRDMFFGWIEFGYIDVRNVPIGGKGGGRYESFVLLK